MYLSRQRGMVQLFVVVVMAFLILGLPPSTKSVQKNQKKSILAYSQLGQSCKLTSGCQPPLICTNKVCKKGVARTGNRGLNQSCTSESNCRSPYVCYANSGTCKVRSGGECSKSGDCYANHYCSRTNKHCKDKSKYNLGDYSVEGVSISSMLGRR